jgi:uncharacterized coiled-coil protein SlyX
MDGFHDDEHDVDRTEKLEHRSPGTRIGWVLAIVLLFVAAAAIGGGYAYKQSMATSDLTVENQSLRSTVDQMRNQIRALTDKLDQMTAPAPAPAQPPAATAHNTKRAAPSGATVQDRRMKQMQSQLAEQQKQLKETQDQIASARSELEGQMGATRDELNGSIAKTHDELVSLEKRGERSYYEFDLSKSKSFQREGPIQISLRKADSKHQSYDLMMLVDDHELSKKKVDLYEPIWLHQTDQPQPVQVVVNLIDKNHIHGYVSAPKYRGADLQAMANSGSSDASASGNQPSSDAKPSPARQRLPVPATPGR